MIKIIDVAIYALGEGIKVFCPNCGGENAYTVMPSGKEIVIRHCKHCPAILAVTCEHEHNSWEIVKG